MSAIKEDRQFIQHGGKRCVYPMVYLHHTMVLYAVKSYYTSNFHSTVCLNYVLYVWVLVSHNVQYYSTWNFYSVFSKSKFSSPVNLVSFHSFVTVNEFRETYFWDDPHRYQSSWFLRITSAILAYKKIKLLAYGRSYVGDPYCASGRRRFRVVFMIQKCNTNSKAGWM